jgi:hypothetical protein
VYEYVQEYVGSVFSPGFSPYSYTHSYTRISPTWRRPMQHDITCSKTACGYRVIKEKKRILFPIRLVPFERIKQRECFDADTGQDIAREIREYFIPDFTNWEDPKSFESAFNRLLSDLEMDSCEIRALGPISLRLGPSDCPDRSPAGCPVSRRLSSSMYAAITTGSIWSSCRSRSSHHRQNRLTARA